MEREPAASSDADPEGAPDDEIDDDPEGDTSDSDAPSGKYSEATLREVAKSAEHQLTHAPKNKFCKTCQVAKATRSPARRKERRQREAREGLAPIKFGSAMTADHLIVKKSVDDEGGDVCGLTIFDQKCDWLQCYPAPGRKAGYVQRAFRDFVGPQAIAGRSKHWHMYMDGAQELKQACIDLDWAYSTSTPYRSESNAVAECGNRKVVDGTRANLWQSGLPHGWWPYAARHFCWMHNSSSNKFLKGATPWEARYHTAFPAKRIPFGALVHFRPSTAKNLQKFDARMIYGVFLGYRAHPGSKWSGDYLIASLEDFRKEPDALTPPQVAVHSVREILFDPKAAVEYPLFADRDARERVIHDPTSGGDIPTHQKEGQRAREGPSDPPPPLPAPDVEPPPTTEAEAVVRKRDNYITLDRVFKFGVTPGCNRCHGFARQHTKA